MLVTKAKLKDENPIVIDLFQETLSTSLQQQLLTLEKPPKSLKEWYKWASRLDNNYKRIQRILGRTNTGKSGKKDKKKTEGRKWNFSKKDPNAMDVVRGCSASSDISSNISLSPLYIPPHRR